MRKKNIWKKATAIIVAAMLAGSTNTSGLQNCLNVQASDKGEVSGIYTIDGVQWNIRKNETTGKVELQLSSPLLVEGKEIEVPAVVEGIKIDVLADGSGFQGKSLTIPNGIEVQKGALDGCAVDTLYYKGENCSEECVPENCKNIVFDGTKNISIGVRGASVESIICKNTPGVFFGYKAVANAKKLKQLIIEDSINRATFEGNAFESCISLEQCEIHSKSAVLYQASFANCGKLQDVTFDGYAIFHASQYYCDDAGNTAVNQGGAFYNCFQKEYDANGKLIKKVLTFKDGMCSIVDNDAPNCKTRVLENCSGLTDVVFENGAEIDVEGFFYDCENLSHITFDGATVLSAPLFQKLPALKKLEFYGELEGVSDKSSPFEGCTADMLIFYNSVRQICISGMKNLTTIYFGGKYVGLSELNGGKWQRNVTLENCDNVESIIFDLDPAALSKWEQSGQLDGIINLKDNLTRPHNIYGHNYNKSPQNFVEYWTKNYSKGTFVNMIDKVETYFDGQVLGENLTAADIDTSKIVVKATFSHQVEQCLKEIGYSRYEFDPLSGKITVPTISDGCENSGYKIEQLPAHLVEGENIYKVMYSGILASGTIVAENKEVTGLSVQWKDAVMEELVENQPVTIADVVSGGTITYNDGTTKEVNVSQLMLNTNSFSAGENIVTVSLKENPKVSELKTILVRENYIVSILATYEDDKTLYAGDKVDVSKIKLTPIYKYDEDTTVNRQIDFTKISSLVLSNAGNNKIQVHYNDVVTELIVFAEKVVPVKVYASFDSANYSYRDGQEIDPKTLLVTVEYNNGAKKSGEEISYAYTVDKKMETEKSVTATVIYEGVESEAFSIAVMPKEVSHIKAKASILAAVEGTRIVPTSITEIEVFYNNGKSEVLESSKIDYENLVFSDYKIVAYTDNTITVTYLGKSDTITIYGIPNTITGIYAEYKGNGVVVGSTVTTEDVAVHALNSDGRITDITQGILLEHATIYNVGQNTVTIHYGSYCYDITVMGFPMETTNNSTEIEMLTPVPTITILPDIAIPKETPASTAEGEKIEVDSSIAQNTDVIVTAPSIADSVATVSESAFHVEANVKKIQLSEKMTYKVYTKQTVKLTIVAENVGNVSYQIVKKNGNVKENKWLEVEHNTVTVKKTTKPSVIYLKYTDTNGKQQTVHTNGFFIDKTKATVNVKSAKTYKKGHKIVFKDVSGIKSATLDGKQVKSGVKVKKKGQHVLVVTDKAGNKKKVVFKVK